MSNPHLSSFSPQALLQLQQDLHREDAAFHGSLLLQGEEQQSVRQLPSGGRGGVRPRATPP